MTDQEPTDSEISKAVGRYLRSVNGQRAGRVRIALGALRGFPAVTDDPAVIARAIDVIAAKAATTSSKVAELQQRQRIRDLRAALERAQAGEDGTDDRAVFIAYGAQWAARRPGGPIEYATFREMGVPAADLKAAGITRRR
jgi:hypothetical protein